MKNREIDTGWMTREGWNDVGEGWMVGDGGSEF
jgi:hypothetical protein